ncbi:hypothetical protein DFH08DRAFT_803224 [Mycena albidolilacea]|uniref:Uncharacterized protein n=1 Tax=Mycena albidolilacea TaxID=1033008 RepID=A0AAD7ADR7_9AGAR|nr:hypothetical protein DFH08DRAFT_803224 [Mycena albidolilacea]
MQAFALDIVFLLLVLSSLWLFCLHIIVCGIDMAASDCKESEQQWKHWFIIHRVKGIELDFAAIKYPSDDSPGRRLIKSSCAKPSLHYILHYCSCQPEASVVVGAEGSLVTFGISIIASEPTQQQRQPKPESKGRVPEVTRQQDKEEVELARKIRSEQPRDQRGRYKSPANTLETISDEPSPITTPFSLSASSSNQSSQLFDNNRDLNTPPTSLFVPTVQKTPTPPPVQQQQQKKKMVNAEIVPMFSGDPETAADPNAVNPSTFIKKFRSHIRDLAVASDADRIDALLDYLDLKWYKDLKEWERELMGMKLKVEELDTTVQVVQLAWVSGTFSCSTSGNTLRDCQAANKMLAQMSQAALNTLKAPANPPAANPFGQGGGSGNLFGQGSATELSEEGLAKLRVITEKLGRSLLRHDAPGCVEYQRCVTVWESTYAGTRPRLVTTGYPLAPGMLAPGSGECFFVWEDHHPEAPKQHLRVAPVPVNAVADWMDFGDVEEGDFRAQQSTRQSGPVDGPGYPLVQSTNVFLDSEIEIVDLYEVGTGQKGKCEPFIHWVSMHRPQGEWVWVRGLFDGRAMANAMDKKVWERNHECLGGGGRLWKKLRMASGQVMESGATWEGTVEVEGVQAHTVFKVFDSSGGWEFLFGKPLQTVFTAIHDYKQDTVDIEAEGKWATLTNQRGDLWWKKFKPPGVNGTCTAPTGAVSFADAPARRVHFTKRIDREDFDKQHVLETIEEDSEGEVEEAEAMVEEVEDREDTPSSPKTEIHVRPEDAWPYTHTNSGGAHTPARGVLRHSLPLRENSADRHLPDASEEGVEEGLSTWWAGAESQAGNGEEARKSSACGNSVGSVQPPRGECKTVTAKKHRQLTVQMWKRSTQIRGNGEQRGEVTEAKKSVNCGRTEPSRKNARDLSGGQRDPRQGSTSRTGSSH